MCLEILEGTVVLHDAVMKINKRTTTAVLVVENSELSTNNRIIFYEQHNKSCLFHSVAIKSKFRSWKAKRRSFLHTHSYAYQWMEECKHVRAAPSSIFSCAQIKISSVHSVHFIFWHVNNLASSEMHKSIFPSSKQHEWAWNIDSKQWGSWTKEILNFSQDIHIRSIGMLIYYTALHSYIAVHRNRGILLDLNI